MENTDQTAADEAAEAPESEVASEAATDPKTALAEHLEQCRNAVAMCFSCGGDREQLFEKRIAAMSMAERLMRVSLKLAKALDLAPNTFTHHIVVEHRNTPTGYETDRRGRRDEFDTQRHGIRDPYDFSPPPPSRKSKTIPGVAEPRIRNIG
jgi:hypothetical protein